MSDYQVRLTEDTVATTYGWPSDTPGLAVVQANDGERWMILHIRSGIGVGFFSPDGSENATEAARLLGCAGDWTVTGYEVKSTIDFIEVSLIIFGCGGHMEGDAVAAHGTDFLDV